MGGNTVTKQHTHKCIYTPYIHSNNCSDSPTHNFGSCGCTNHRLKNIFLYIVLSASQILQYVDHSSERYN